MSYKLVTVCPYCGYVSHTQEVGELCWNCVMGYMKEQENYNDTK